MPLWPVLILHIGVCLLIALAFAFIILRSFRAGNIRFIISKVDQSNPLFYMMVVLYLLGTVTALSFVYNDLERLGVAPHLGVNLFGLPL